MELNCFILNLILSDRAKLSVTSGAPPCKQHPPLALFGKGLMANADIGQADNIQMELTSGSAIVEAWLPGLVLQSRLNTHHIYTDVSVGPFFHSLARFHRGCL
jgi:hypothetical protein